MVALLALAMVIEEPPEVAVQPENAYPEVGVAVIVYAVPMVIPLTFPETVLPLAAPATVKLLEGTIKV